MTADDFFQGYFETAMQPDELLTAVRVPRRPGVPWGYQKFVRRANDWAIVGVAAVDGRVALANMGPRPLRAPRPSRRWQPARPRPTPQSTPPRAPRPARTCTPTGSTAGTWPGCLPGGPWSTRQAEVR